MAYGGDRVSSVAQKESMVVELGKVGDCSMLTRCRRHRWKFIVWFERERDFFVDLLKRKEVS